MADDAKIIEEKSAENMAEMRKQLKAILAKDDLTFFALPALISRSIAAEFQRAGLTHPRYNVVSGIESILNAGSLSHHGR